MATTRAGTTKNQRTTTNNRAKRANNCATGADKTTFATGRATPRKQRRETEWETNGETETEDLNRVLDELPADAQSEILAPRCAVVWEAQPMQSVLISCPVEDVFFGGARGGGKTDGSLGDFISHQDLYGKNAKGIFFRLTYDELEEAQGRAMELFTPLGAIYSEKKRTWRFPNGATLKMRYLARLRDAGRYQGHQYTWMCFEELTNWPDPRIVDLLRACLRSGKAPIPKSFRATGNPGGVGHNWVKSRYIDPATPLTPFYDEELETWRVFIPSRLEDNAALMENDPDYWKRVKAAAGGNEALLAAWRWGNWDIVAGGMFDDVFARDIHVIEPFKIPESWYVDRAYDHGSSKPFSVGWYAESDGTTAPNGVTYPRGTIFRIAEWYGWNGKPNEGKRLGPREIAKGIREREGIGKGRIRELRGLKVNPGPADTQIFDVDRGTSIADDMAAEGVRWTRANKNPGSRINGWTRYRELLANGKERPMENPGFFVFDTCIHWIRTVPVLPRDDRDQDDVNTDAEDHVADESRYRILARAPKKAKTPPRSRNRRT